LEFPGERFSRVSSSDTPDNPPWDPRSSFLTCSSFPFARRVTRFFSRMLSLAEPSPSPPSLGLSFHFSPFGTFIQSCFFFFSISSPFWYDRHVYLPILLLPERLSLPPRDPSLSLSPSCSVFCTVPGPFSTPPCLCRRHVTGRSPKFGGRPPLYPFFFGARLLLTSKNAKVRLTLAPHDAPDRCFGTLYEPGGPEALSHLFLYKLPCTLPLPTELLSLSSQFFLPREPHLPSRS